MRQIRRQMLGATVWRAQMHQPAVNTAIGADISAPRSRAAGQLTETSAQSVMLGEPGEFGVKRGKGLEQLVIDFRLAGLFGALLWNPAARFEQLRDLEPRVKVFRIGELLPQQRFELGATRRPLRAQPLGCFGVEGNAVRRDPVADHGDPMLELHGLPAVAVGSQETP